MSLTQSIDQAMYLVALTATTTGARPVSSATVNTWAKTSSVDFDSLIDQCVDLAEQENNFSIRAKTIVAKFVQLHFVEKCNRAVQVLPHLRFPSEWQNGRNIF